MPNTEYFLYFTIFVVGLVIGRITMAIQYSLMKRAANTIKAAKKKS